MPISFNIDGSFYDEDYFERGIETQKSWYTDYHWMPQRSFREALLYIDCLKLDETSYVLDYGTAKGFLVKALRELEIKTDGCDISEYALSFAPKGCWNCSVPSHWENRDYTHVVAKDVFEHLTTERLIQTLERLVAISSNLMCVVPMGDNGTYRIREYHADVSHLIAENENWWRDKFYKTGWKIIQESYHIKGLKDNWAYMPEGNRVFVLEK